MKKLLSIFILAFATTSLYGAGFRVALQSAKQQGMGHTGAGLVLGPENIFFNPGALAFADGGVTLGGSAILPNVNYNLPGTTYTATTEDYVGTPVQIFGSFKLSEKLAGGLGVYTPFGSKVEWENDWAGRYVSQSIDLKTFFIQPTLSYKVSDRFGLGASFIYAIGGVTLERGVPLTTNGTEPDVKLQTDKSATGTAFQVGAYVKPTDEIGIGVSYRSMVSAEATDGNVTLTNIPSAASSLFTAKKFDATLPLPGELVFGTGVEVTDKLTLAGDLGYTFWSDYKELKFTYDGLLGGSTETVVPQKWEDSWKMSLGGSYDVNERFIVRAGGAYDFTPVPDETLSPVTPDLNKYNLSAGFSFMPSDKFSVDGSYMYVNGKQRTVAASDNQAGFGQRYKTSAKIPALGLNYKF